MKRTAREISELVGGTLHGDASRIIESVASLRHAGATDLTYAEDKFHGEVAKLATDSGRKANRNT